jgi:four helix bundle protein
MQRFTDLKVWQRGHALVLRIYALTKSLPADERFGLVTQLRRAIVSVTSNIAEGSKRKGASDYAHFLNISEGSLAETENLVIVARDLGYLEADATVPLLAEADEIARMLYAFRLKVEAGV